MRGFMIAGLISQARSKNETYPTSKIVYDFVWQTDLQILNQSLDRA